MFCHWLYLKIQADLRGFACISQVRFACIFQFSVEFLSIPSFVLSPSQRRHSGRKRARGEDTNSVGLFTPGETKALAKSKVHQWSLAWVTNVGGHPHWLAKFKICCCTTNDDSEITNISCNYVIFLQDFANFKTFSKAENRLKTSKRTEQSRRR
jgi:hypothetical protein